MHDKNRFISVKLIYRNKAVLLFIKNNCTLLIAHCSLLIEIVREPDFGSGECLSVEIFQYTAIRREME